MTTTSTQTTQSSSSDSNFSIWLAFAGVILAALIALITGVSVAVYNNRRTAKLQRELIKSQGELQDKLTQSQRELVDYQKKVADEQAEQDRERQKQEKSEDVARKAVEQAKTTADRVEAYRNALSVDPRISQLQILDMSHPLNVTSVFIQVKLHEEPNLRYDLDTKLLEAQHDQRDPNEMLRAGRMQLEQRASVATSPEQAIGRHKRCVFVGDPGAGKTTLLKYLTLKSAAKQLHGLPDFPIHIELNAFASSGYRDLLDLASTRWADRYGFPKAEARTYMDEALKDGQAFLLLDALDEAMVGTNSDEADASYKLVSEAIQNVATRYHQSPIVVTARKAGY